MFFEKVLNSRTIFVGGIGTLSASILEEFFAKFGTVREITTKQGFAFITFETPNQAAKACENNHYSIRRRVVSFTAKNHKK